MDKHNGARNGFPARRPRHFGNFLAYLAQKLDWRRFTTHLNKPLT